MRAATWWAGVAALALGSGFQGTADATEAGRFDAARLVQEQDVIRVDGNRFVDESGETFVFRGVSIADPAKLLRDDQWSKRIFEAVRSWGANTVRLPVHPAAWREHGRARYLEFIDDAVRWCNELGMYLIVDWHSIGYLPAAKFTRDSYITSWDETRDFWNVIAGRYAGVPTVAVYELFNEPTTSNGEFGDRDWPEWKAYLEEMIDIVYAHDTDVIPLVAGFDWAYSLGPVRNAPVDREGIAYASHPYPQKERPRPPTAENFAAAWEAAWGFVADDYPMILTELGWVREDGYGAHIPVINDGSYGPMIVDYMESKGVSWIAWVFDPNWSPVLITDWDFTPSEQGRFFRDAMLGHEASPGD